MKDTRQGEIDSSQQVLVEQGGVVIIRAWKLKVHRFYFIGSEMIIEYHQKAHSGRMGLMIC